MVLLCVLSPVQLSEVSYLLLGAQIVFVIFPVVVMVSLYAIFIAVIILSCFTA